MSLLISTTLPPIDPRLILRLKGEGPTCNSTAKFWAIYPHCWVYLNLALHSLKTFISDMLM